VLDNQGWHARAIVKCCWPGRPLLLVAPVLLAAAGVSIAVCLVVLMFVPVVTVVG